MVPRSASVEECGIDNCATSEARVGRAWDLLDAAHYDVGCDALNGIGIDEVDAGKSVLQACVGTSVAKAAVCEVKLLIFNSAHAFELSAVASDTSGERIPERRAEKLMVKVVIGSLGLGRAGQAGEQQSEQRMCFTVIS